MSCFFRQRCPGCPYGQNPIIQGDGSPPPRGLMIIGEAPGNDEVKQGRPFVGRSGQLLRKTLRALGVVPEEIRITNATICHPTGNATPTSRAIESCRSELLREIFEYRPRKILTLGATALEAVSPLHSRVPLGRTRGLGIRLRLSHPTTGEELSVYLVPTFHPAYILREEEAFRDFAYDIEKWLSSEEPLPPPEVTVVVTRSAEEVRDELAFLREASVVSCDIESSGFEFYRDELFSVGFGAQTVDGKGYGVIIPRELIPDPVVSRLVRDFVREFPGKLVFHNAKFDLQFLWAWWGEQVLPRNLHDTMLLNYCRDERPAGRHSGHSLKSISRVYYDIPDYGFDFDSFVKSPEETRDWERLYRYQSLDCYQTVRYFHDVCSALPQERPRVLEGVYSPILIPGSVALTRAEYRGIRIDRGHLEALRDRFSRHLDQLGSRLLGWIDSRGGRVTNLNSPKQMVDFLFGHLKLPGPATTEKESLLFLTTRVDPDIKQFIEEFLDYRLHSRVLGTYIEGLLKKSAATGRIHPDFWIHGTATGRLSCHDPNVQNIPVLMGTEIRKAFLPSEGFLWVDADESQLELRVAAELSRDEAMIQAYRDGRDIHREVASAMFGKPPDQITDYERYLAKYVDFGVIYQRSAQSVANGWEMTYYELKYKQPKWTVEEAEFFISQFLGGFPGLQKWINEQKQWVRRHGYVETLTGARREFPLRWANLASIERQAVNTPIQGTASHITFAALSKIQETFVQRWPGKAYVLMTVHDSIGCEVHESLLSRTARGWEGEPIDIIRQAMETPPVPMVVPLKADIKVGTSWGDAAKD